MSMSLPFDEDVRSRHSVCPRRPKGAPTRSA